MHLRNERCIRQLAVLCWRDSPRPHDFRDKGIGRSVPSDPHDGSNSGGASATSPSAPRSASAIKFSRVRRHSRNHNLLRSGNRLLRLLNPLSSASRESHDRHIQLRRGCARLVRSAPRTHLGGSERRRGNKAAVFARLQGRYGWLAHGAPDARGVVRPHPL
jgi:hypothetical protein